MTPTTHRVCAEPGCPTLTPNRRCPTHTAQQQRTQAARRRANNDQAMTVYSGRPWRTTSRRYLTHHPRCAHCGTHATQADHRIPRRILLAAGIHRPDDDRWLQPLCTSCHSRKTASIDVRFLRRLDAGEDPEQLALEADRAV